MKTAIITGASAGLGTEFFRQTLEVFPEIEQFWLIARRRERLEEMAAGCGRAVVCLPLDLCSDADLDALQAKLEADKPEVALLINNAGCGYLGNVGEADTALQTRMVDLNVRALTAVTSMVIPYVAKGGRILNVSSIASFCVNPRMTVYSSTKAFVSSFTLGIDEELRPRGISATAVCPGPMSTEFLDVGGIRGNSRMFAMLPYCDQARVAGGALRAARDRRTFYTPRAFFKFYRVLAKIVPAKIMVKLAKT